MRTEFGIYILLLMMLSACTERQMPEGESLSPIRLSVVADGEVTSRAYLYDGTDGMVAEKQFALNAYLIDGSDTPYITNAWVYYEEGWRFRDETYQGKLLDYYWPNDHRVNFLAYMPYDWNKSVVNKNDLSFTNSGGVSFGCTLPGTTGNNRTIDDTKDNDREIKHEFVYAYRHDCQKGETDKDPVKLRFVHPFAAIKFELMQSHRNLTVHSITLSGVHNSSTYTHAEDTYDKYKENQNTLTHAAWDMQGKTAGNVTVNYEKTVPTDINYYSLIGGPYLVIPQSLTGVTLTVKYSWDTVNQGTSTPRNIATAEITSWEPGMLYTYTLDLGDNKEEILFQASVEAWTKGEDEGYENHIEVK